MQEEGPTTSDTEVQTNQTECRGKGKEKSNKINLDEIISKPKQFALLLLLALFLTVTFIPTLFVHSTMLAYNDNTTLASMHTSTATNLIIAFVTVLYVWLTGYLVKTSEESIKLSKESIEKNQRSIELSKEAIVQSRKEQKIRDIENRLEKFYMPAQSTLKVAVEYLEDTIHVTKWSNEIKSYQRDDDQSITPEESANIYVGEKLKEIEKYRFLAKGKTCRSLINFLCEGESTENRLEFSNCIQEDIEYYLVKLHELKKDN